MLRASPAGAARVVPNYQWPSLSKAALPVNASFLMQEEASAELGRFAAFASVAIAGGAVGDCDRADSGPGRYAGLAVSRYGGCQHLVGS